MAKRFSYIKSDHRKEKPGVFWGLMYDLVLIILLLPTLALPVRQLIFLSQRMEIRSLEACSGQLEKMIFTQHEYSLLDFTRGEREFRYRGNMYDVYSISRSGGQVTVLAVWDKPESMLLMALAENDAAGELTETGAGAPAFMPYFFVGKQTFAGLPEEKNLTGYRPYLFGLPDPLEQVASPPPESAG